jgi:hypothetical protein
VRKTYGNVVQLSEPTSCSSNSSKREGFIKDQTELVLSFYVNLLESSILRLRECGHHANQFGQVNHGSILLENPFSNDEPSCQRCSPFPPFLLHAFQHIFQTFKVVMVVPFHSRSRDLNSFLSGEAHRTIGGNDVATLAESWDDRRDG